MSVHVSPASITYCYTSPRYCRLHFLFPLPSPLGLLTVISNYVAPLLSNSCLLASPILIILTQGFRKSFDRCCNHSQPLSGLGEVVCTSFAKAGANVAINYFNRTEPAERVKTACEEHGVKAVILKADMTSTADAKRVVEEANEALGGLDIIIGNAVCLTIDIRELLRINSTDVKCRAGQNSPSSAT